MREAATSVEDVITADHTANAMLEVYKSVLSTDRAVYVSAPITSGKRYMRWLEKVGKKAHDIDFMDEETRRSHALKVVLPNSRHAGKVVQRIREASGSIVINPTAVPSIERWKQEDWRLFWRRVIERYAAEALFVDDWQYSNGCAYEFWVAHSIGLPTKDEEMRTLSLEQGIESVLAATIDMKRHGVPTDFIEKVARDMEALPATYGGSDGR